MAVDNKFPWPDAQECRGLRRLRMVETLNLSNEAPSRAAVLPTVNHAPSSDAKGLSGTDSSDVEAAACWIDRLLATSDSSITTARWSKFPGDPMRPSRSILDLTRNGRISPEQGALLYEVRRMIEWKRRPWWDRLIMRLLGGGPWTA